MDAIIIGAGMSGLLSAIKLKERTMDFVILERAGDLGGTWHHNVYPGSGCDVPSHLYSYSFAPNPGWSRAYSLQPEIKDYFKATAAKYDLARHIRFNTAAVGARWDEDAKLWTVTTANGESLSAPFLILGTGQLNKPAYTAIAGRESFAGDQFHSAEWNFDVPIKGRKVAVIGSGASAVQFVPHLVRDAASMTMFQRSANWIMERKDSEIPKWLRRAFALLPPLRLAQRGLIYFLQDQLSGAFEEPGGKTTDKVRKLCLDYLETVVADPVLRAKLTPDYLPGCKRILVSDDFLPALTQPNAFVETRAVSAIEPAGVRLADGTLNECDVIVWGTGFDTHHFVAPLDVRGRAGHRLADDWAEGAQAYRGVSITGYPNMFVLYGPNTNTGHISIIFMVEQQVGYMMQGIDRVRRKKGGTVEVKPEAQAAYNADIQERLSRSVWASGCTSWYRTASGTIPNNYPGRAGRFKRDMKRFHEADFVMSD